MEKNDELWIFVGYNYLAPVIVRREVDRYEYKHTGLFKKSVPLTNIPTECFGLKRDVYNYGKPTGMQGCLVRFDLYGKEQSPIGGRESAWIGLSARVLSELQSLRTRVHELQQDNQTLRMELFDSAGDGMFDRRMVRAFKATLDARQAGISESERFGSPFGFRRYPYSVTPGV